MTVTYVDENGEITIYKEGSRSWRNNNMGNMVKGAFAKKHGAIGDDGRFAVFPDYATGRAAEKALLIGPKYSSQSIADAVASLTPKVENDTQKYLALLKKLTGLDVERKISDLNSEELDKVLDAIKQLEGWTEGTVEHPKKVKATKKDKHGDIVAYQLEGSSEFIAKSEAVQMTEAGEIYAVVVHSKRGAYLRAYPDSSIADNFDSIAV
jgi:hypothetical protein